MRIYIIGNDGITLGGETTPQLNAGEIAIGSSEDCMLPRSAASACWRCGMPCPVSRSARRLVTVTH
jgi:hypothetical protein